MTKTEIINILDSVLKIHSFEKKANTWSKEEKEFTKIVTISKSKFNNGYYVNYGIIIKNLDLHLVNMHLEFGLGTLVENFEVSIIDLFNCDCPIIGRKEKIVEIINEEVIFFFESINSINELSMIIKKHYRKHPIPIITKNFLGID
jgi:hypothetical protein